MTKENIFVRGLDKHVVKPCTKKSFPTKDLALAKLKIIEEAEPRTNKKPIRAYHCPKCQQYHLTSLTERTQKKIEKQPLKKLIIQAQNMLKRKTRPEKAPPRKFKLH